MPKTTASPDAPTSRSVETLVDDDESLLELTLEDMRGADALYQPTNYWRTHNRDLVPEIKTRGLKDFRRRHDSKLGSFGASDLVRPFTWINLRRLRILNNRVTRLIPGYSKLLDSITKIANDIIPVECVIPDRGCYESLIYSFADRKGAESRNAKPLSQCSMSLVGNPEDVFTVDCRNYSELFIHYYLCYSYVSEFVEFGNIDSLVELGPGGGKQAELVHKLHPNISILLFDIAPQLYVLQRYLSCVFHGDVVSYRETRDMIDLRNIEPGKIYIFGSWQFPLLRSFKFDLFWNAASFQEMEPDVVDNYLSIASNGAEFVFLQQQMRGSPLAPREGIKGVLKQTTRNNYVSRLGNYLLLNESPTVFATSEISKTYSNAIWEKNKE